MTCEDLVTQCFLDERAPLVVPELNHGRTLKYLECCYQQGLSWEDAKQQIEGFLQQRGVHHQGIVRQLQLLISNTTIRRSSSITLKPALGDGHRQNGGKT